MQPEGSSESTKIYEWLAWLELHAKQVIYGAVAAVVVIIGLYVYVWHRGETELEADEALILQLARTDEEGKPQFRPSDLLQLAEERSSTSAAEQALLHAAAEYYRERQYAEAQRVFERLVRERPDSLWAPIAALGAAVCMDAQDKADEAAAAYRKVIQEYGDHPAAAEARYKLALLYETQGKLKEANDLYNELGNPDRFGMLAMRAIQRREKILREHPELAPPEPQATNRVNALTAPVEPPKPAPEPAAANQAPGSKPKSAEAPAATNRVERPSQPSAAQAPPSKPARVESSTNAPAADKKADKK